jgi:4-amino-4-deoxy-L-arabinose transferase-like glycosyltransferase
MSRPFRLFLTAALLLIAAAMRTGGLTGDRLHADEALFAAFARDAVIHGRWLFPGDLDKPPLALYAAALSMTAIAAPNSSGVLDMSATAGELAARLPGFLAALVTTAALFGAARRLYRDDRAAFGAALVFALSPLAVRHGATAFTDGLMVMAGALAVRASAGGRAGWAGIWTAVSIATKIQGAFFIPLLLLIQWTQHALNRRALLRLIAVLLIGGGLLVGWDALRPDATPFYLLANANNPLTRLIRSDEVVPRLAAWLLMLANALGVGGLALAIGAGVRRGQRDGIGAALTLFLVLYLGAHWLIAFNLYDRYLLIALIPIALLVGRGLTTFTRSRLRFAVLIAVGVVALSGAWTVGNARRDAGFAGVDAAAAWIDALSTASVIYDPWFGWHMRFYLSPWSDKRRVYYPTPRALADGASALNEAAPRYLIAPADRPVDLWLDALRARGWRVTLAADFPDVRVFRINPPG